MSDRIRRINEEVLTVLDATHTAVLITRLMYLRTQRLDRRGYYLSLEPVTREHGTFRDGRSWTTESWPLLSGQRHFVEPAPRFSAKRLDQLATLFTDPHPSHWSVVMAVMRSEILDVRATEKAAKTSAQQNSDR